MEKTLNLFMENPWVVGAAVLFILLILYFLFKFFSVFFEFIQAKGCLTVGLVLFAGLPGIIVLSLISGYTVASTILIVFAVIGAITGYIARDSEGGVGTFGRFIMIVSIITLVIAIFLIRFL